MNKINNNNKMISINNHIVNFSSGLGKMEEKEDLGEATTNKGRERLQKRIRNTRRKSLPKISEEARGGQREREKERKKERERVSELGLSTYL